MQKQCIYIKMQMSLHSLEMQPQFLHGNTIGGGGGFGPAGKNRKNPISFQLKKGDLCNLKRTHDGAFSAVAPNAGISA